MRQMTILKFLERDKKFDFISFFVDKYGKKVYNIIVKDRKRGTLYEISF